MIILMSAPSRADQGVGISSNGALSSMILVQFPNLPAMYHGLEPLTIKWVNRTIDYVSISYSLDNGNKWIFIVDSVEASLGEYEWIVPDTSSDKCLIRVSTNPKILIYDISDHPFSITSDKPTENYTRCANSHDFLMKNAYPNPFNPSTRITYSIPKSDFVTLKIYNSFGREIRILVSEIQKAGEYTINFDASNLSSGIYFFKLQVGSGFVDTKKMLFLK